jgi:hypothetical protein
MRKAPLFHDAPEHAPGELYIDHKTGLVHRPNHDPIPLSGPTTGAEYEELKQKEILNSKAMAHIRRQMASTFQCTQCKRKFSGKFAVVKWLKTEGVLMETLICFDQKCAAPVVMIKDGLDVRTVTRKVQ